ncbi:MAG TPA: phosphoribosylamine--glycine ligase [Bacteroidales bacterium]|nr:phosphoribosylamine--glycine ligase [Bacteroidales bacterium]HRZ48574.1 phosphoribosylamine--glycine ligase [Bacteroidales bacterium]
MRALILGSGGREHALAWKLSQSGLVEDLYILPGNPGTAKCGVNLSGSVHDFQGIRDAIVQHGINLLIIGPEDPLVHGLRDFLESDEATQGIGIIGPGKAGAKLEGSKAFAKEFMQKYGIPTAAYRSFSKGESARASDFLRSLKPPYVLKADGLAAGKGVLIHTDLEMACREAELILEQGKFGEAGNTLVIEEFLEGIEISVFILTDGKGYVMLPEAKDYKRIGEGNTGLNTGGMGTVSPVPFYTEALRNRVEEKIIRPTLSGLESEGIPYLGFIFFGLMICGDDPYVIEYNVRLGDPEAESVLPRVSSDLGDLFLQAARGRLGSSELKISREAAATVMLVSGGYPGSYPTGIEISGLEGVEGSLIFHAGTRQEGSQIKTAGGRVLGVTSLGTDLQEALNKSYQAIERIGFDGRYFRSDIGSDVL